MVKPYPTKGYLFGFVTGDGIGVDCKSTAFEHGEFDSLGAHNKWSIRLTARTPLFHGGNNSSILLYSTK